MKKYTAVAAMSGLLLLAGCGIGPDQSREDAGDIQTCRSDQVDGCVDKSDPNSTAFNNHFPNVEDKCDGHGHRIFVMTHDSAQGQNMLVLPDPSCPGYIDGKEPAVVVGQ